MAAEGRDPSQIRVAGTGRVLYAELGVAAPADAEAEFATDWHDLGYTSEDGVTFGTDRSWQEIRGWQSTQVLRRVIESEDTTASFSLLQTSREIVRFAFGGGEVTEVSVGQYRFDPAEAGTFTERQLAIEMVDGDIVDRFILPRGIATELGEIQAQRTEARSFEVTFGANVGPGGQAWYLLSNDPAMEPAGGGA